MAGSKNSSEGSVCRKRHDVNTHVEVLASERKCSDRPAYHEKNRLRTYGDDEVHDVEPAVSPHRRIGCLSCSIHNLTIADVLPQDYDLVAMAFLWTGGQIPVYIFGRLIHITHTFLFLTG
jgi:hypothetical protein